MYINFRQDISENGADVSHLKTVHEAGIQVGTKLDYKKESWKSKLLTHEWKVNGNYSAK